MALNLPHCQAGGLFLSKSTHTRTHTHRRAVPTFSFTREFFFGQLMHLALFLSLSLYMAI